MATWNVLLEGGPEEDGCHKLEDTCTQKDGCHKLEDTCTQKRRLENGREGGQGPTRTVEPWSSSSTVVVVTNEVGLKMFLF